MTLLTQTSVARLPSSVLARLKQPISALPPRDRALELALEMIEVQSGSYLGEDDIVRLQDTYGRG